MKMMNNDTVWLSANQMALLFDRDEKTIRKHINNVFNENELDRTNNTQKMRVVGVKQKVPFYTLDVIISPLCRWMQTYSCVFISGISGKEQCTV